MAYAYEKNMTQDMLDCLISNEDAIAEFEMCREKYEQAKAASKISLPAIAASGESVLHGARCVTENIANYWYGRMQAIYMYLPIEYRVNN